MKMFHNLVAIAIGLGMWGYVLADSSITSAAKSEYQRCFRETDSARKECTFGGCGNILGTCYERQIAVIETDSEKLMQSLKSKRCGSQAIQLNTNFETLQEANSKIDALSGSWSEFDLKVRTSLLKNHALRLLAKECGA